MSEYRILSIDGGGIRGILPASFLAKLSADLETNKKPPLERHFHKISGTSTGGIIALAVALEMKADVVRDLYVNSGEKVFDRRLFGGGPKNFFASKYKNAELKSEFKRVFGDKKLGECCCEVCIPSVDLATGASVIFTRQTHANVPAWEVAMATTAAPLYFPSVSFGDDSPLKGVYADGGLWANNPTLAAISVAMKAQPITSIRVLSLGTGTAVQRLKIGSSPSGLRSWGLFLVEAMMFAQSSGVDALVSNVLHSKYHRLNVTLQKEESSLDALDAVKRLRQLGEEKYATDRQLAKIKFHFFSKPAWP